MLSSQYFKKYHLEFILKQIFFFIVVRVAFGPTKLIVSHQSNSHMI
jgi:hypothetical protein